MMRPVASTSRFKRSALNSRVVTDRGAARAPCRLPHACVLRSRCARYWFCQRPIAHRWCHSAAGGAGAWGLPPACDEPEPTGGGMAQPAITAEVATRASICREGRMRNYSLYVTSGHLTSRTSHRDVGCVTDCFVVTAWVAGTRWYPCAVFWLEPPLRLCPSARVKRPDAQAGEITFAAADGLAQGIELERL